jgi:hypothetical protein
VSEYQYYEFRSIDRPLSQKEMDELRALSTRAEITPTSFTNTYHWGDFKGDPDELMDRYFDAFVYVANWGTHRLMLRIPRRLLDVAAARAYCDGDALTLKAKKDHVVLEFLSEDESGDEWTEGEHWMPSLISLRAELMRGDLRALYVGWLASLRSHGGGDWNGGKEDPEDGGRLEPPVPPGLPALSAALRSLTDFLRVDADLIGVAAAGSAGEPPAEPSGADLARLIKGLTTREKDDYLLRFFAEAEVGNLRAEIAKRIREAAAPPAAQAVPEAERRTVAQLLAVRDALAEEVRREAAERAAKAQARREREQAEARARYLGDLAGREPATWQEVEDLIATKRPTDYDRAVALLVDLRDLAGRSGRAAEAESRLRDLRQRHASKPSLLKRLDEKKLGT